MWQGIRTLPPPTSDIARGGLWQEAHVPQDERWDRRCVIGWATVRTSASSSPLKTSWQQHMEADRPTWRCSILKVWHYVVLFFSSNSQKKEKNPSQTPPPPKWLQGGVKNMGRKTVESGLEDDLEWYWTIHDKEGDNIMPIKLDIIKLWSLMLFIFRCNHTTIWNSNNS